MFSPKRDPLDAVIAPFATEQERTAIIERATAWADQVLREQSADRSKPIQCIKLVRQANPRLSLLEAKELTELTLARRH